MICFSEWALANSENNATHVEFDPSFLSKDQSGEPIDVGMFEKGNPIYPGTYSVDVYVNDKWRGRESILFVENPDDVNQARLCVNSSLVRRLGIDTQTLPDMKLNNKNEKLFDCLSDGELTQNIYFHFLNNELRLNAIIPQAYLKNYPKGYVDRDLWETGVPSAFVSYRANHYQSRFDTGTNFENTYVNLTTGVNLGNWHLRHLGNYRNSSSASQSSSQYDAYETYLQRDIPSLRSQLKLGDIYSTDMLFRYGTMRGVQLSTDDRMLPSSQRGYAPIIRGQANSNALVSIKQNEREIYNITVPAGPFLIDDLYPTGGNGELLVTVTEADGTVKEFMVPYANATQLMRPKISRFEVNLGVLRQGEHILDEKGVQGTWQYGVNNLLTANTGLIWGENYQSVLLGGALSTPVGALGFDVTYAKSHFDKMDNTSGERYRVTFSQNILSTKTNINASVSHYSGEGFYTWEQVGSINDKDFAVLDNSTVNSTLFHTKQDMQISLNQRLPDKWGNIYLNTNLKRYQNQGSNRENSWSAGYANSWRNVQYSFSLNNSKYNHDRWRKEWIFSVSMPLDILSKRSYLTAQINEDQDGNTNANIGLSGVFGEENQYNYGLNAHHNDLGESWSANMAARAQIATLSGSYGEQPNSSQWSAAASGGLVVHEGGATLANEIGETFAIIQAEGAKGAKVNRGQNVRLDGRGYAIVPHLSAYEVNKIGINPKGLPLDVEMKATKHEVIPRANSSTMIKLDTSIGHPILLQLASSATTPIPVGAAVFSDSTHLGSVTAGGRLFTRGLPLKGVLNIKWGDEVRQQCTAPYSIEENTGTVLNNNIRLIKLDCHFSAELKDETK